MRSPTPTITPLPSQLDRSLRRAAAEVRFQLARPFRSEHLVRTELCGHRLRVAIRARRELRRAFPGRGDEVLMQRMLDHVSPGDTVYDIGSNIGVYAILLASHPASRGCRVHAFEPEPRNHRQLRRNIDLNGLTDVVSAHALALGMEEGEVELFVRGGPGEGRHSTVDSHRSQGSIRVSAATASVFASRSGSDPDVLKIDVEGAEGRVLAGADEMIRQHRPREIFLEIHPKGDGDRMPGGGTIRDWLEERGYSRVWQQPQQAGRNEHYR